MAVQPFSVFSIAGLPSLLPLDCPFRSSLTVSTTQTHCHWFLILFLPIGPHSFVSHSLCFVFLLLGTSLFFATSFSVELFSITNHSNHTNQPVKFQNNWNHLIWVRMSSTSQTHENLPDYGGGVSRVPLQLLLLQHLHTAYLSHHCLSKSLWIQVEYILHLSNVQNRPRSYIEQAAPLQVTRPSEWSLPVATGFLFFLSHFEENWKVALVSPSFPQVACINSCYGCPHLLLRQHRASHLEVGDILQTLSERESGSKHFSNSRLILIPCKNTALPRQPGRLLPVLE